MLYCPKAIIIFKIKLINICIIVHNNQYYVVGNINPKNINNNVVYDLKEDGVYDTIINDKKIVGLISKSPEKGSLIPQV